ncbi:MAG: hypothetical protein IPJ33_19510 [Gammaproteobacteria bacterium]|nr:hypothetical protein [Gammaproteobacteria bacterium]
MLLDRYGLFAPLFPDTAAALERVPEDAACSCTPCATAMSASPSANRSPRRSCTRRCCGPRCVTVCKRCSNANSCRFSRHCTRRYPEVISRQVRSITIPRRFATPMREIRELQQRLITRRQPQKLAAHPRFRAAYDFVLCASNPANRCRTRATGGRVFRLARRCLRQRSAAPRRRRRRETERARRWQLRRRYLSPRAATRAIRRLT